MKPINQGRDHTMLNSEPAGLLLPVEHLKQKRVLLIEQFLEKKLPNFMIAHSNILDAYFSESFARYEPLQEMTRKNPLVLVAQGGYGRQEQCIHSDVDILLLFKKKVPPEAEAFIQSLLYPLWDLGLEVGHAVRSLKECISIGKIDFQVLTSLLDARFICGEALLFDDLVEEIRKQVLNRQTDRLIAWQVENNRNRHAQFGDSSYRLEPNLKEGRGGLRDYHVMLWIAKIISNPAEGRKGLEDAGYLSRDEFHMLSNALAFIFVVRNRLHHLAGRKCDQLYFKHQIRLANELNFDEKKGQKPVERFLGKLHGQMEFIKQLNRTFLYEIGYARGLSKKRPEPEPDCAPGIVLRKGRLDFSSEREAALGPGLLMKIFEESARLQVPLSSHARRTLCKLLDLMDEPFIASRSAMEAFEGILSAQTQGFSVLNEMLTTGFLQKFIPEFDGIVHRIQYDTYHLYPVDKHSLRTVQTLKNFRWLPETDPFYHKIIKDLSNPTLLYWAALLHDIGKGEAEGNHSAVGEHLVRNFFSRRGYSPEDVETVSFLVAEHLLLAKTATRRDTNDEETAIVCARRIKTSDRLKMLYLLTVADSMSTGPKAWNEWTGTLLRDLFLKTLGIMEKGEFASSEAIARVEQKKARVVAAWPASEKEVPGKLIEIMSPRYLLYSSAEDICDHIRLFQTLGNEEVVWKIAPINGSGTRTVTVCAKDRPGLFSKIAGIFTLHNFDILEAQVYTWRNNIALDIFKVKAPLDTLFEHEKWIQAEKSLKAALSGQLDLSSALQRKLRESRHIKPPAGIRPDLVVVDNGSSNFFTIVEVFTHDFTGLLYGVTHALFQCGLDVWVAKISTMVDQVVDVFYVRDFDGQKIEDPAQVQKIKSAVLEVLTVEKPEAFHASEKDQAF